MHRVLRTPESKSLPLIRCARCILLWLDNKLKRGHRCPVCERHVVVQVVTNLRLKIGYLLYD